MPFDRIVAAIAVFVTVAAVLLALRGVTRRAAANLRPTVPWMADAARAVANHSSIILICILALGAGSLLVISGEQDQIYVLRAIAVLVVVQMTWWASVFGNYRLEAWSAAVREPQARNALVFVGYAWQTLVFGGGTMLALSNAGIDVTALLAGAGVGGIALALAGQGALKDAIACFTIFTEQPFRVGDEVHTGNFSGTVEKVGLRSVVILARDGRRLTIPNSTIIARELICERSDRRRGRLTIPLRTDQGTVELTRARIEVQRQVEQVLDVRVERVSLVGITRFGAELEVLFHAPVADYDEWRAKHEMVLLAATLGAGPALLTRAAHSSDDQDEEDELPTPSEASEEPPADADSQKNREAEKKAEIQQDATTPA